MCEAAAAIAPERAEQLAAIAESASLVLIFDPARRDITVNPRTGEIRLGIVALEHLWAAAHFYYVLYQDYANAQRAGDLQLNVAAEPRSSRALDLLNWALRKWGANGKDPWPKEMPRPARSPPSLSDVHIANELFLAAFAWTIHHEIAHVRLQHPTLGMWDSQIQERDADVAATDWVLGQAPNERARRKRAFGIIVGILALDTFEAMLNDPTPTSHPPAFQRLAYCLDRYGNDEHDEAFAVALCGMQFNAGHRKVTSTLDGESFRRILDELLLAMYRR
jgi:hypothetical protein